MPNTLPPGLDDLAPWGDTDIGVPPGPAPAFSTNPSSRNDDQLPTIGHIGRYALKYKIGAGGLGTVYAAHDPLLSRLIAIKTLNLEVAPEERDSFNALFLNEARAAGGLSHPHIVTVFDAGISHNAGDDSAYIAMELLKGRDLRQLRQEGWRPTPAQAALIVRRVADALAYAHSKGVVHRDIKPANIFMVGRTQPRVLDFGIARVAHQRDGGAGGDIAAGSPYYMAPEQARHEVVDRRADVFSLGVVLYELLTDQKPFQGTTLSEITNAVLEHDPPMAHHVVPSVPSALGEIAGRAMEKDPEHRFRSARSLSRELRHWLDENANAPEHVPPSTPLNGTAQPRLWPIAALAALVLAGVVVWAGLSSRPTSTVASAPVAAPPKPARADVSPPAAATAVGATAAVQAMAATPVSAPASAATTDTLPAPAAGTATTTAATVGPSNASNTAPGKSKVVAAAAGLTRDTLKDRRARETREREAKAAANAAAPAPTGTVRIAVSPWGQVEVNGSSAGTTPPLNELTLPEGKHQITVRNTDFPPYSVSVTVSPGQPVTVKHKFGS
jgi:serine/threonine-protein kinase